MLLRSNGKRRQPRVGAHLVEFALVVPIFFLFLFGMVEIGRGMMVSSLVTNAARSGCRSGVIGGRTTDSVKATANNLLASQGVVGSTTTVEVNGSTATNVSAAQSGDIITVKVSVGIAANSWMPGLSFVKGSITGQFSMPHE